MRSHRAHGFKSPLLNLTARPKRVYVITYEHRREVRWDLGVFGERKLADREVKKLRKSFPKAHPKYFGVRSSKVKYSEVT